MLRTFSLLAASAAFAVLAVPFLVTAAQMVG